MMWKTFCFFLFLSITAVAQVPLRRDSSSEAGRNSFHNRQQPFFAATHLVIENNVIHPASAPTDLLRAQIWQIEAEECNALRTRDTASLKKIWLRDFSQEMPPPEGLVAGKNTLPYYLHFTRTIEDLQIIGSDMVQTTGFEWVQLLDPFKKIEDPVKRNYNHVWSRKKGIWILVLKNSK